MSWNIVLFNSKQQIESIKDVDESQLVEIYFSEVLLNSYTHFNKNKKHIEIKGLGFSFEFFLSKDPSSNIMIQLFGENAIYELIEICKINGWQIYDSSLNQMIDFADPEKHGPKNHNDYVSQILKRK